MRSSPISMTSLIKSAWKGLALSLFASVACVAESESPPPWSTQAWTVESGMLWEVGNNTPFAYRLVPKQLSWRSAQFWHQEFQDGSRIVLRHRLALIADLIQNGPESHYVGFSGSPSLEWWDRTGAWSLFTGAGGGFGLVDSRGVTGGQGRDFTLNWFIRGGFEHVISCDRRLGAGIMFQHMSNGGMTDPNPSINALGFTLEYGWAF